VGWDEVAFEPTSIFYLARGEEIRGNIRKQDLTPAVQAAATKNRL